MTTVALVCVACAGAFTSDVDVPRYCPDCRRCWACRTATAKRPYRGTRLCQMCYHVGWRTCWRKIHHADDAAAGVWIRGSGIGGRLAVYDCALCDGWHVTRELDPPAADFVAIVAGLAAALRRAGALA